MSPGYNSRSTDSKMNIAIAGFGRVEFLSEIVHPQIMRLPKQSERRTCMIAANQLWRSGFLDKCAVPILDAGTSGDDAKKQLRERRKEAKRQRRVAVDQLQAAGFLPSGFLWLLVRYAVVPFIQWMIEAYIFPPEDSAESLAEFSAVCGG